MMIPTVKFISLPVPLILQNSIDVAIAGAASDMEQLNQLRAAFYEARNMGMEEEACHYAGLYQSLYQAGAKRRVEVDELIQMARFFVVGLSLN